MVEGYRASEDGRVKAHNVLRGKLDAVDQGHWPGSKPPFGFKVKHILGMVKDREEVLYSLLEHDSETAWIIKRLYQLAEDTGWGQTRLARALNDDPQIPAKYKPFLPATAGYWLDLPLYYGELVWPTHNTGIVDDARVLVPCKPDEIHRYPNFCKPIVDRKQWDTVQGTREAHRKHHSGGRRKKGTERLIVPMAPGLVLRYLLTGLVCCGHCHRAMTPSSSRGYTRKDGR